MQEVYNCGILYLLLSVSNLSTHLLHVSIGSVQQMEAATALLSLAKQEETRATAYEEVKAFVEEQSKNLDDDGAAMMEDDADDATDSTVHAPFHYAEKLDKINHDIDTTVMQGLVSITEDEVALEGAIEKSAVAAAVEMEHVPTEVDLAKASPAFRQHTASVVNTTLKAEVNCIASRALLMLANEACRWFDHVTNVDPVPPEMVVVQRICRTICTDLASSHTSSSTESLLLSNTTIRTSIAALGSARQKHYAAMVVRQVLLQQAQRLRDSTLTQYPGAQLTADPVADLRQCLVPGAKMGLDVVHKAAQLCARVDELANIYLPQIQLDVRSEQGKLAAEIRITAGKKLEKQLEHNAKVLMMKAAADDDNTTSPTTTKHNNNKHSNNKHNSNQKHNKKHGNNTGIIVSALGAVTGKLANATSRIEKHSSSPYNRPQGVVASPSVAFDPARSFDRPWMRRRQPRGSRKHRSPRAETQSAYGCGGAVGSNTSGQHRPVSHWDRYNNNTASSSSRGDNGGGDDSGGGGGKSARRSEKYEQPLTPIPQQYQKQRSRHHAMSARSQAQLLQQISPTPTESGGQALGCSYFSDHRNVVPQTEGISPPDDATVGDDDTAWIQSPGLVASQGAATNGDCDPGEDTAIVGVRRGGSGGTTVVVVPPIPGDTTASSHTTQHHHRSRRQSPPPATKEYTPTPVCTSHHVSNNTNTNTNTKTTGICLDRSAEVGVRQCDCPYHDLTIDYSCVAITQETQNANETQCH